jgi:hypothetical protein
MQPDSLKPLMETALLRRYVTASVKVPEIADL